MIMHDMIMNCGEDFSTTLCCMIWWWDVEKTFLPHYIHDMIMRCGEDFSTTLYTWYDYEVWRRLFYHIINMIWLWGVEKTFLPHYKHDVIMNLCSGYILVERKSNASIRNCAVDLTADALQVNSFSWSSSLQFKKLASNSGILEKRSLLCLS